MKNKKKVRKISFGHFLHIIDLPFEWLRKLTMPPVNEDEYNHIFTVFWPFLGFCFLIFNFLENKYYYYLIGLALAIPTSYLLYFFKPQKG